MDNMRGLCTSNVYSQFNDTSACSTCTKKCGRVILWIVKLSLMCTVILGVSSLIHFSLFGARPSHDWDVLIFTQHWPSTVCYQWQEKSQKNNCILPEIKNTWTIHGIWPSRAGGMGPQFCNSSWKFDPSQLYSIEKQLEIYWLNIEKNTPLYSFWKHEWQKHGTCAAILPELNSESKYFGEGLNMLERFNMNRILAKADIVPDDSQGYMVTQVFDAITSILNVVPRLQCIHDKHSNISYISEIRICFDKSFNLIDCVDNFERLYLGKGKILTNCDMNLHVIYPNAVPDPPPEDFVDTEPYDNLHTTFEMYKLINALRWLTF